MASFPSNRLKAELGDGFSWSTATVKMLLIAADAGHVPDPDVDTVDVLAADESTAENYARQDVTGRSITRDDDVDVARWLADDVVFPTLGAVDESDPNIAGAYLFVDLGDDSTSWPLAWLEDVAGAVVGTDWTVTLDPAGVIRVRAAA